MPQLLKAELSPARLQVEPGGAPLQATVTLQNLSDAVQQYGIEVVGLDAAWYTLGVEGEGIGLFPKDTDQVRLTFHPPVAGGVRAGTYPFEVRVRARDGSQEQVIQATLEVRGRASLRLDLMPLRQTSSGKGRFRLQLANTGTADAEVLLEATDAEEACRFEFPKGDAFTVPARGKIEVPVTIVPKHRPWTGEAHTYDFQITARSPHTRSIVQPFPGQLTYQPRIRSLGPLVRAFGYLAAAGVVLVGLVLSAGRLMPLGQEFGRRYCTVTASVQLLQEHWPCGETVGSCHFAFWNREAYRADKDLIGECRSNELADAFGNTRQFTTKGVLFWLKASQTVYYFTEDRLYVFDNGQLRLLDSPDLH